MSRYTNNHGFTLIEMMVTMAIGALLVLAAMVLYVPVSRSFLDQGVVSQQTLSEAVNYDFDVLNIGNAGYGVVSPKVNTDLVLVRGTGPGNNSSVAIPTSGTGVVAGNGVFWDWETPAGSGNLQCAGLEVVAGNTTTTSNERLVYYEEATNGSSTPSCTGSYWNSASNWDAVTVVPSVASGTSNPIQVYAGQDCDLRGSQIAGNPVLHTAAYFDLPIAKTLTGGFFAHAADKAPVAVCFHNLP